MNRQTPTEPLSLQMSRRIIESRECEKELERAKAANPEKFAEELQKRLAHALLEARATLAGFLSEDDLLRRHLASRISQMPRQSPFPFVTVPFPRGNKGGATAGAAFEYRGNPESPDEASMSSKLTVVYGSWQGQKLVVGPVPATPDLIAELSFVSDVEPMAMTLLEAFGPIESA